MLTIVVMWTFLSISLISQNTKLTKTTKWNYYKNRGQIKIVKNVHLHPSFLPTATLAIAATLQDLMWHPPAWASQTNDDNILKRSGSPIIGTQTQISGSSLVKRTPSAAQGLDLYFPSLLQIPLPDSCIPPPLTFSFVFTYPWMNECESAFSTT